MAVKWKPSATLYVFCFIVCSNTLFVNGVRVQSKRIKGVKGELWLHIIHSIFKFKTKSNIQFRHQF